MSYKLKDSHTFAIKVAELFEKMQALGVSIEVGSQQTIVTDNSTGQSFILKDADQDGINNNMTAFPCPTEYKLIII